VVAPSSSSTWDVRAARVAPSDLLALTKPRIVALVVLTVAAAYTVALSTLPPGQYPATLVARSWVLLHALLGTALVAGGTNALNQHSERDVDALMRRTRNRPLPSGRLLPGHAALFAWVIAATGVAELALLVNGPTALLALLTLVSYVFAYTPLKRRTTLATLVGAVPGALPVVGGWTAATGAVDAGAIVLFGILFLWQIPHFLALSWMYREDYARAGLRMLSIDDDGGRATFRQAAINAAALIPISLAPTALLIAGRSYFVGAFVLSTALFVMAVAAARSPGIATARRLFLATLVYLPALLGLMVVDRL
jgi:heme o synthase